MPDSPSPHPRPRRFPGGALPRFSAVGLLIALIVLMVAAPFIEDMRGGELITAMLVTFVVVAAVFVTGSRGRTLALAVLLAAPAITAKWITHLRPDYLPRGTFQVATLVFLVFVVIQLLRFILRAPAVTLEVLCAGIASYLMLGLVWVAAYGFVAVLDPTAFTFNVGTPSTQKMDGYTAYYFSFTTLTTAGYGDIVPASKPARMLATLEMIVGVLYVAILISRLVALHASPPPKSESGNP